METKDQGLPPLWPHVAGMLYLLIILLGAVGHLGIRGAIIAPGDVISTVTNMLDAQGLWRLSIAGDVAMQVLDVPVMLVLFLLFKSVNPRLALLALLFNIVQTAVLLANKQNLIQALLLASSASPTSNEFPQLANQAYLLIDLHNSGFSIGLIFFGFACLLYGYLIVASRQFPKVLGVLMALAGCSYLVSSLSVILAPDIAGRVIPILALSLVGEVSFALWLTVKGATFRAPKFNKEI